MKKIKVRIKLISNTVFGSGKSVPGGEDIAVLTDNEGFPYLKASTFKGILREAVKNIIDWTGDETDINELFGRSGEYAVDENRLIFSDFTVHEGIKKAMLSQDGISRDKITDCFTGIYTFTGIEDGIVDEGSLRSCRYIEKGNIFYGEIICPEKHRELTEKGLRAVKYIGTMKTRGFGRVRVEEVQE